MPRTTQSQSSDSYFERYLELKLEKARNQAYRTLRGIPLGRVDRSLDLNTLQFPFPIVGCFCVQDSPDNPCPCTDMLIWITDRPVDVSWSGRRTSDGQEMLEFTLSKDAEVSVEVRVPFKFNDLERIARLAQSCGRRNGNNNVVAQAAPPLDWLTLAGAVGYGVGTLLDDLFGSNEGGNDNLSDDLSDWAAENFPAPDWLKDLF